MVVDKSTKSEIRASIASDLLPHLFATISFTIVRSIVLSHQPPQYRQYQIHYQYHLLHCKQQVYRQGNTMSGKKTVTYKGNQYDITDFINRHPGGVQVIEHYLANSPNITEVFKSIHSSSAQRSLLALPQVAKVEKTKTQKTYLKIEERLSKLYQPSIIFQVLLVSVSLALYVVSICVSHPLVAIFFYSSSQILTAWICHSQLHNHNKRLKLVAKIIGGVVLGLSAQWWNNKHTAHHLFTNSQKLDQDMDHNYRTILFPLLLFKWRISSLCAIFRHMQFVEAFWIIVGYYWLLNQKLVYMAVGALIASFYIAVISFGNHERQLRYRSSQLDGFLSHQMATTTDYDFASTNMILLLGGFHYHTEHHLFPQVPFYRLDQAKRIILEQLPLAAKEIKVSSIF